MSSSCWCHSETSPHTHVNAYAYDTACPETWHNAERHPTQGTLQWVALVNLLYKLGITVFY